MVKTCQWISSALVSCAAQIAFRNLLHLFLVTIGGGNFKIDARFTYSKRFHCCCLHCRILLQCHSDLGQVVNVRNAILGKSHEHQKMRFQLPRKASIICRLFFILFPDKIRISSSKTPLVFYELQVRRRSEFK